MTLEQLTAALAAAALSASSCACKPVRRDETFVAARTLGESTASPGADHDRPLARPVDTQEVSTPISGSPGPAPAPEPAEPAESATPTPPSPPAPLSPPAPPPPPPPSP
jgi:hypothetical protein